MKIKQNRYGTQEERFWAKVNKTDGCWEWTGIIIKAGYGHFSINDRYKLAHRVSYEMHYGPVPPGLCVRHICDNPKCVRPDHLLVGTQKENIADCIARGRKAIGERNGFRKMRERHKLTDAQVAEIIDRYKQGGVFQRDLADEYGVSQSMISAIVLDKRRLIGREST